uniref:Uncharacterized protein n=1 Tax=Oryzias latipes TaxID=8090 RepID=A0A3P9KMJ8_ORYLA
QIHVTQRASSAPQSRRCCPSQPQTILACPLRYYYNYLTVPCETFVNSKSHGGYTPLHIAAIHGHTEVMELLVQRYGASISDRDNDGRKAIHYLEKGASMEVRALLGGQDKTEEEEEDYKGKHSPS